MSSQVMMVDGEALPMVETYRIVAVDPRRFTTPEARCILGGAGTGKTEHLLKRISALLAAGAKPGELLVLCATPSAAIDFRERLALRIENIAYEISIITPRALALEILSTEMARAYTRRPARLLASFEVNFLLEDMKTVGTRPGRLREILKFFYRGWTELAEDDPEWLIMAEEVHLHRLLLENLTFMQAMLEPELSKLALGFLRGNDEACQQTAPAHIFVDDYGFLSRASQLLAQFLAVQSITVAADPFVNYPVFDSYPYLDGVQEFMSINSAANRTVLSASWRSAAVTAALGDLFSDQALASNGSAQTEAAGDISAPGLAAHGKEHVERTGGVGDISGLPLPEVCPGAPSGQVDEGTVTSVAFSGPAEEFEGVATKVEMLLASGLRPRDIGIVSLHELWGKQVAAHLMSRGIQAATLFGDNQLRGDIRDLSRSFALRVYTALRLTANPADSASWRCWCGFGDYLTNSAALLELKSRQPGPSHKVQSPACTTPAVPPEPVSLLAALATKGQHLPDTEDDILFEDPTETSEPILGKVLVQWQKGQNIIAHCADLRGQELLNKIMHLVASDTPNPSLLPPALFSLVPECASAVELARLLEERLLFPHFDVPCDQVRVLVPSQLCGLHFKAVIVCGAANGFLPCRDYFDGTIVSLDQRERMRARDLRLFYLIVGTPLQDLIFTWFRKIDLESAERLKLKIARIRLEKGQRVCLMTPSQLLELIHR
ncbi:MAG: AAA family ATPase [Coriobacteriales bacterium]|jgi:hypothetical protein|nr:AAA family ATPase [Coriobacteriales bacterium]